MELYRLIRPLLFRLAPETAHHVTLAGLRGLTALGPLNPLRCVPEAKPRQVMGLTFLNPIGLAAGLDKNGECIDGFAALGFGFIEVGTVTPRPQAGNAMPRLFRLVDQEAIINRLGFNNKGVEKLIERVRAARYAGVLGINIGKGRDTPIERAIDDYLEALAAVYPYAGYVAVNISSPNTPGLRQLERGDSLERLLLAIVAERNLLAQAQNRRVPLVVKISPDLTEAHLEATADALLRHGIDGVIATNTTVSREGIEGHPLASQGGGLSGRPLFKRSTVVVERLARLLDGRIPIIACGGVFNADDARRKLEAGASLVQLYTGLIYRGPGLVKQILRGL